MPEWIEKILTLIGIIIGSGLVQFFINRRDAKKDKIDNLGKELDESIKAQNEIFQKRYDNLKSEIEVKLEERDKTGKEHYHDYKEQIQKLNEAILQLTKNDTEQHQYMKYIGEELMGLAHDKLVYLTDIYQLRGAITLKEKATLEAIYKPYHEGLGGNGDGEQGYCYAMSLPVVTDAQAREMDLKLKIQGGRL